MTEQHLSDATTRLQGLDDFVHTVMRNWKVQGLAIAVVKESDIIYAQGFGQRDAAQNLPVTPPDALPHGLLHKSLYHGGDEYPGRSGKSGLGYSGQGVYTELQAV